MKTFRFIIAITMNEPNCLGIWNL